MKATGLRSSTWEVCLAPCVQVDSSHNGPGPSYQIFLWAIRRSRSRSSLLPTCTRTSGLGAAPIACAASLEKEATAIKGMEGSGPKRLRRRPAGARQRTSPHPLQIRGMCWVRPLGGQCNVARVRPLSVLWTSKRSSHSNLPQTAADQRACGGGTRERTVHALAPDSTYEMHSSQRLRRSTRLAAERGAAPDHHAQHCSSVPQDSPAYVQELSSTRKRPLDRPDYPPAKRLRLTPFWQSTHCSTSFGSSSCTACYMLPWPS